MNLAPHPWTLRLRPITLGFVLCMLLAAAPLGAASKGHGGGGPGPTGPPIVLYFHRFEPTPVLPGSLDTTPPTHPLPAVGLVASWTGTDPVLLRGQTVSVSWQGSWTAGQNINVGTFRPIPTYRGMSPPVWFISLYQHVGESWIPIGGGSYRELAPSGTVASGPTSHTLTWSSLSTPYPAGPLRLAIGATCDGSTLCPGMTANVWYDSPQFPGCINVGAVGCPA